MHPSDSTRRPNAVEGLDWITWEKKIHTKELTSENYYQLQLGTRARLTLPRSWCAEAGIGFTGEAVIAGRGMSFEFWSPENFSLLLQHGLSQTDEGDSGLAHPIQSRRSEDMPFKR